MAGLEPGGCQAFLRWGARTGFSDAQMEVVMSQLGVKNIEKL